MTAAPSIPVIDAAALLGEPMTALCQAPWTQVTAATDSNRCKTVITDLKRSKVHWPCSHL